MFTSPIDVQGNEFAKKVHNEFSHWRSELVLPKVQVKLEENPKAANAYVKITYVNNWTNIYALRDFNFQTLLNHLNVYAHAVELDVHSTSKEDFTEDYPMEVQTLSSQH